MQTQCLGKTNAGIVGGMVSRSLLFGTLRRPCRRHWTALSSFLSLRLLEIVDLSMRERRGYLGVSQILRWWDTHDSLWSTAAHASRIEAALQALVHAYKATPQSPEDDARVAASRARAIAHLRFRLARWEAQAEEVR